MQIRNLVDTRRTNERARENRVEIESNLIFGCLRSRTRARIPLPLTATDTDTTCGVIGQGGYLGTGTNAPTQACSKSFSLPSSLGTPSRAKALTHLPALPTPIWSQGVSDHPHLRYSLDDYHLSSVFFIPKSPRQVWKLRSHSHGKAWIGGYSRLEISEQGNRFNRRASGL